MALIWKDRVKETSTTTGTGTYTLAGAVTGFQSFSAIGNANTCYYCATDGTNWEVGLGTYTSAGTTLARTSVIASSNSGSAVNWAAGTRYVFTTIPSIAAESGSQSTNDFRLTLTTALPVTVSDVTSATTIYFTPYKGNKIALYSGSAWVMLSSSEVSLAVGTITSGLNYDVFAYSNSGTLTLEALAWTNDTTRATALVRQDGVWCKTGALTRRYVGTFRTTSTTTTEDSLSKRFLFNADNQVPRKLLKTDSTANWTYNSATVRSMNNSTANRVEVVLGLPGAIVGVEQLLKCNANGGNGGGGIGVDSTTTNSADLSFALDGPNTLASNVTAKILSAPGVGYHYYQALETGGAAPANFYGVISPNTQSGLLGSLLA